MGTSRQYMPSRGACRGQGRIPIRAAQGKIRGGASPGLQGGDPDSRRRRRPLHRLIKAHELNVAPCHHIQSRAFGHNRVERTRHANCLPLEKLCTCSKAVHGTPLSHRARARSSCHIPTLGKLCRAGTRQRASCRSDKQGAASVEHHILAPRTPDIPGGQRVRAKQR